MARFRKTVARSTRRHRIVVARHCAGRRGTTRHVHVIRVEILPLSARVFARSRSPLISPGCISRGDETPSEITRPRVARRLILNPAAR